ncbi:hypothetical protein [Flavobacterium chungangensis]|uniref:Outer membrane protein beta-barrel domain-containing protein n=1 Tax=Flavobacterium chungangensis TaxID=2708132 RepID=A0ABV8Z8E9_9FLAO
MKFYNLKGGIFLILMMLSFSFVNAQAIRGFGNVTGYSVSSDFKKGVIVNLGGGAEFEFHPIFKPEIAISYSLMGIKDQKQYDFDTNTTEINTGSAYGLNFSLGPKICFWCREDDEDELSCIYYITPKVNMSRIIATGNYAFIDHNNASNNFYESRKIADWQHSFGLSVGMEIPVSETNSIAISIDISNINFGKTLNRLPYNNVDYTTVGVGAGLTYYFGIRKGNK